MSWSRYRDEYPVPSIPVADDLSHCAIEVKQTIHWNDHAEMSTHAATDGRKEMFYLTTHSTHFIYGRKEGNVLFNDALNAFYLRLYGVRHMVKDHSDRREETCCRHIGYSLRLAARVLLYASSHRQDNTYHGVCNTSRVALVITRNSSMGPPWQEFNNWPSVETGFLQMQLF